MGSHADPSTQNKPSAPPRMNPPTYQTLTTDLDGLSDPEDASPQECSRMMAASRKASLEALKLYSGCFDFCYTPMERFCASRPSQSSGGDESSDVESSDVESSDASYIAMEMMVVTGADCEGFAYPGSPRPSSDTLSVSRYQEPRKERKEHVVGGRSRTRRRLQKKRPNTNEKVKASRV